MHLAQLTHTLYKMRKFAINFKNNSFWVSVKKNKIQHKKAERFNVVTEPIYETVDESKTINWTVDLVPHPTCGVCRLKTSTFFHLHECDSIEQRKKNENRDESTIKELKARLQMYQKVFRENPELRVVYEKTAKKYHAECKLPPPFPARQFCPNPPPLPPRPAFMKQEIYESEAILV